MGDNPIFGGDYGYSAGDLAANPLAPGLGKPSSAMQSAQTQALLDSAMIPKALWENTSTMRGNITGMLNDFTSGNTDVTSMPAFAPGKSAIEDVYSKSRENIMADTPAGGALTQGLSDLEQSRSKSLTDLISSIQTDLLNKAYGAGYGTPQLSMAGANAASSNINDYMAAKTAQSNQNAQGVAEAIGYMASK